MKTIDESLRIADGYNSNVKVNVAAPEHEAIVCLAAEVRRLRHQWQYYQDFCKQNGFDGITAMAVAVDKLREENERLRKDAERMNGDIADLRQLIARYRERELTMGWNQE